MVLGGLLDQFRKVVCPAERAQIRMLNKVTVMAPMDPIGEISGVAERGACGEVQESTKRSRTGLGGLLHHGPQQGKMQRTQPKPAFSSAHHRYADTAGSQVGGSTRCDFDRRDGHQRRDSSQHGFLQWFTQAKQVTFPTADIIYWITCSSESLNFAQGMHRGSGGSRTRGPAHDEAKVPQLSRHTEAIVSVLEALELIVVNKAVSVFGRVYAWLDLLQTWCSLRFDDHRGLEPSTLKKTPESLKGFLSRSKTHRPSRTAERKRARRKG